MAHSTFPRAYSYTRFSSAKQREGDSLRRQIEAAEEWCARDGGGVELDTNLRDLGVAAFKGRNAKIGALGRFLKAIRDGKIAPGSVLIVENLDRLSRDEVFKALDVLRPIIDAGVDVVTLMDNQRYTRDNINDPMKVLNAVLTFSRGHEESKTKSNRLSAAWSNKRKAAASARVPMITRGPGWLEVVNAPLNGARRDWRNAKFVVREVRAKILRQIFQWSTEGWGYKRIAKELNRRKVEPWKSTPWNDGIVCGLLKSRAPLGDFQTYTYPKDGSRKRIPVGDVIKDYYPRIISDDLWESAQTNIKRPTYRGRPGNALLSGLVVDPNGVTMYFNRTKTWRYALTKSVIGQEAGTVYRWQADHLEEAVLLIAHGIDWQRVFTNKSMEPERLRLENEIAELDRAEKKTEAEAATMVEMALAAGKVLGEALRKKGEELDARLAEIQHKRAAARAELEVQRRSAVVVAGPITKKRPTSTDEIHRLNLELKSRLSRIQAYPDGREAKGWPREFLTEATEIAPKASLLARKTGRVMGALRFFFANGTVVTAFVTHVPNSRFRSPQLIGFAAAEGMTMEDWDDCFDESGWEVSRETSDAISSV
jgi:DNA invertase Pin-like site-specific DNA recombinase